MRIFVWTALAAGLSFGLGTDAAANDTVRLGGPAAGAAIQGGTDTQLVHYRRAYYGGGYARSYYGGGFYGGGFYGGNYGRGYYGSVYFRPSYASFYYSPYSYRPYYSSYYYYRPYYLNSYYYPCGDDIGYFPTQPLQATYQAPPPRIYAPPMPPANQGDGTFRYDGDPGSIIPMPAPSPSANPAKTPGGIIPLDGRLVSLPSETTGGVSPVGTPATQRQTGTTPRVTYPAYGEEPIPQAPRKR